jgi:type II secretory pathway pseudopilin PulG
MFLVSGKRGQVWVETAIYTLIGLTVIAIVLSVATPQLQRMKDRGVVSQTADSLFLINKKMLEVGDVSGNIRIVRFKINKGSMEIDGENDLIRYGLENTNVKYSEPGVPVSEGDIVYLTEEYGSRYNIFLSLEYEDFDIVNNGNDDKRVLNAAGVAYEIKIENLGFDEGSGKIKLDVGVI